MSGIIRRQFQVSDVEDDYAWVKLEEGKKKGLEFAASASSDVLEELRDRHGDEVMVTMESQNPQNTRWEIKRVDELDTEDEASAKGNPISAPADD